MTIHDFVHCHICPMKDICHWARPDDSYNFHNYPDTKPWDLGKLEMATENCRIRKLLTSE